jgi:hypothetical protein
VSVLTGDDRGFAEHPEALLIALAGASVAWQSWSQCSLRLGDVLTLRLGIEARCGCGWSRSSSRRPATRRCCCL